MAAPLKQLPMSTVEKRAEVKSWMDELDDEFVAAVHTIVGGYLDKKAGRTLYAYDADGRPIYTEEIKAIYAAELAVSRRGDHMTIEDFTEESETW